MKRLDNRSVLLIQIIIVSLFIAIASTSYAFFMNTINSNAKENVVVTGSMRLEFEDGPNVNAYGIMPGQSVDKTFKVKNIGNVTTSYDVYLSEILNTFENQGELVYTVTSPNGCQTVNEVVMPSYTSEESRIVSNCSINANQEHEYTLHILFKYMDYNQNANANKAFYAKISINEYQNTTLAYMNDEELNNLVLDRVNEIRGTKNTDVSNISGNAYYVSSSGSDDNDGLSESHPIKTLTKVNEMMANNNIPEGSAILFKRGDLFEGKVNVSVNDMTLGTYGDESLRKPVITRTNIDGGYMGEWVEVKPNIWKYTYNGSDEVFSNNVGTMWMFCMDGNDNCTKIMNTNSIKFDYAKMITTKSNYDETNIEDKLPTLLTHDLEFYHVGHGYAGSNTAKQLYLYSTSNPKQRFDSIRFSVGNNIIGISSNNVHNLHVDNLNIMFGGAHGIGGASMSNLVVTNCEIGYIGGMVQHYNGGSPTRFGNAVEIYGSVKDIGNDKVNDGFIVNNNYIYQCYDAGPTFQLSTDNLAHMEKAAFINNVLEYNNYNIEYWMYSNSKDSSVLKESYIKDFSIENNIMRYAGYGLCESRPDKGQAAHIKTWYHEDGVYNVIKGLFVIRNNIFDKQLDQAYIFRTNAQNNYPILEGNYFYGNSSDYFGYNTSKKSDLKIVFDPQIVEKTINNNNVVIRNLNDFTYEVGSSGNTTWTYDPESQTLTISGSGAMADYSEDNQAPWYKYKDYIHKIIIGERVTKLGEYAFSGLRRVYEVEIDSISLQDLKVDPNNVNYGINYTFYNTGMDTYGTKFVFGENVTRIPRMLLKPAPEYEKYTKVTDVEFLGNKITQISNYGLNNYMGPGLIIPEGVEQINGLSIGYGYMYFLQLPTTLTSIDNWALNGNGRLEKIVFGPTINRIYDHSMSSDTSLKTIVMPHINNPSVPSSTTISNTGGIIEVYGDSSTQTWVENLKRETGINTIVYKDISEYKSQIYVGSLSIGQVGYNEDFIFDCDSIPDVSYIYTNSAGETSYFGNATVERNSGKCTIKNVRSDVFIHISKLPDK